MWMRSLGVVGAMVCGGGIEVGTSGGECGQFAFAHGVKVNAVLTGRKVRYVDSYSYAILCRRNFSGADSHALHVHDVGVRGFRCGVAACNRCGETKEHRNYQQVSDVHGVSPSKGRWSGPQPGG